jgi:hypothetical protein
MKQISKVEIYDQSAKSFIAVEFIDGVAWDEVVHSHAAWNPAMKELLEKLKLAKVPPGKWPEHRHWDWRLKALMGEIEGQRIFGIRHDLQMQGLMMAMPKEKSKLEPAKSLVYIDYLAAAPWNLSYPGIQVGRFKQIGRVFLAAAVQLSTESGFEGRVGLLALPQSVSWYQKQGMTEVAEAAIKRLRYFEMTPSDAKRFLEI